MKVLDSPRRAPFRNYFPLPNEIYALGLNSGEIAIYGYLLFLENRKTHQCWPSYKTIGRAVGMSINTVRKYVQTLEDRQLIRVEPTSVITHDSLKRNGNLLYTIRPIQDAVDYYHDQQMKKAELDAQRRKAAEKLAVLERQTDTPV